MLRLWTVLAFTLLTSCGKQEAQENVETIPPGNSAPQFKPARPFDLFLYPDEGLTQKIEAYDQDNDPLKFKLKCDPCVAGIDLDENGFLTWLPEEFDQTVPFETFLDIIVYDNWGASSVDTLSIFVNNHPFRMGDKWNRDHIDSELFLSLPSASQNLKYILGFQHSGDLTAKQGTTLYLGKLGDKHLAMTAGHVYDNLLLGTNIVCDKSRRFYFPALGLDTFCKSLVFKGEQADFAIFELDTEEIKKFEELTTYYPSFVDYKKISLHTPLAISGNGRHANIYSSLTFGYDDDCVMFSHEPKTYESTKKVFSPETNSYEKRAVTRSEVMLTCDVSSGDSGGPVFEKETGRILGIITGGLVYETPGTSEMIWRLIDLDESKKHLMTSHVFLPINLILDEISATRNLTTEQVAILKEISESLSIK